VLQTICNRRSIRKFKKAQVRKHIIDQVLLAAQRAPSGCNFQNYSFIHIRSLKVRRKTMDAVKPFLWSAAIENAPVWIVVCVDLHRLRRLLEYQRLKYRSYAGYIFRSVVDAALATENLIIAAESFGLGSLIVGMVFEAMVSVSEILNLPRGVTPLMMVCLGRADECPPLRPRWPLNKVLHVDRYRKITSRDIGKYIRAFESTMAKERRFQGRYRYHDHLDRLMRVPLRNKVNEEHVLMLLRRNGLSP